MHMYISGIRMDHIMVVARAHNEEDSSFYGLLVVAITYLLQSQPLPLQCIQVHNIIPHGIDYLSLGVLL